MLFDNQLESEPENIVFAFFHIQVSDRLAVLQTPNALAHLYEDALVRLILLQRGLLPLIQRLQLERKTDTIV